jgi:hypothetical protein
MFTDSGPTVQSRFLNYKITKLPNDPIPDEPILYNSC